MLVIKVDKDKLNLPLMRKRHQGWRTPVEEMMRGQGAERGNEKQAKYKTRANASIKTDCKNYSIGLELFP